MSNFELCVIIYLITVILNLVVISWKLTDIARALEKKNET